MRLRAPRRTGRHRRSAPAAGCRRPIATTTSTSTSTPTSRSGTPRASGSRSALGHPVRLEIEPGRYLVAESGYLVTEIRAVKRQGENTFYLLDAGFNNLARPILYGAYHPMSIAPADGSRAERPLARRDRRRPAVRVGRHLHPGGGRLVRSERLPEARVGDFLVIDCAGAYGFVMGSNYNSKPLAAEVLVQRRPGPPRPRAREPRRPGARRVDPELDASRLDPVAHRHALDAAEEARAQALDRAGQLDRVDAFDQVAEHDAQFEAREVRAEAEVLADPERDVTVGRAVDAKRERLVEDLFVAIRRRIEQAQVLAGADLRVRAPRCRESACGRTGSPAWSSARSPRPRSRRVRGSPSACATRPGSRSARARRRSSRCAWSRCRRPRAGRSTRAARGWARGAPRELRVGDHADDVVQRLAAALGRHLAEVPEELEPRALGGLHRPLPFALVFGIGGAGDLVGPLEHRRPHAARHAEQFRQHVQRQRSRELLDQIASTARCRRPPSRRAVRA